MNFGRRLQLYGFGFVIGIIILFIINKNKKCSSPNEMKVEELAFQQMIWKPELNCKMKCFGLDSAGMKQVFLKCRINYDRSDVHAEPFGKYTLEPIKNNEKGYTFLITDKDNVSYIEDVSVRPAINCDCP